MTLLDVNVLVALCDADHVHHDVAAQWFRANRGDGWATCALTENALLRVLGNPNYPAGPGSPDAVRPLLLALRSLPGHTFWGDSVSLTDSSLVPTLNRVTSRQLSDVYLLALAASRAGRLATLDARIDPSAVRGGAKALLRIG